MRVDPDQLQAVLFERAQKKAKRSARATAQKARAIARDKDTDADKVKKAQVREARQRRLAHSARLRLEERWAKEKRIAEYRAHGMGGQTEARRSFYFDRPVHEDMLDEAIRQGRSVSWLCRQAWLMAKDTLKAYPGPGDVQTDDLYGGGGEDDGLENKGLEDVGSENVGSENG